MKRKTIIFIALIGVVLIIICAFIGLYIRNNKTTKNNSTVYYTVPKNSSIKVLAEDLRKRGVISSSLYFRILGRYQGLQGNIMNTRIMIEPGTSLNDFISKLKLNKPDFAVVTIPEGFRLYQIAERLEKNSLVNKDAFVNLTLNDIAEDTLISKRNDVILDLEGFLFPDTYFIPYSFKEKDIAGLMFNRFKTIFTQSDVDRAKELGMSVNDIVTIASLVEREAINDSERSTISGVIYNRLKKGMLLQIDAAVIYANTRGEGHLTRVLNSHLKYNSKYNTYMYKGLPPGPIASPGRPSLEAALYPEKHDYLYYVAGENGHVFSKTYEEHLANVKKYMKK